MVVKGSIHNGWVKPTVETSHANEPVRAYIRDVEKGVVFGMHYHKNLVTVNMLTDSGEPIQLMYVNTNHQSIEFNKDAEGRYA